MMLDDLLNEISTMDLIEDTRIDVEELINNGPEVEDAKQDLIASSLLIGIKQNPLETELFFNVAEPLLEIDPQLMEDCLCNLIIAQLGPYIMYGLNADALLKREELEDTIPEKYALHLADTYKQIADREAAFKYLMENISVLVQAKTLTARTAGGQKFLDAIENYYTDDEVDENCTVSIMRKINRTEGAAERREIFMKYRAKCLSSILFEHSFFELMQDLESTTR